MLLSLAFSREPCEPVIALTLDGEWPVLADVAGLVALQGETKARASDCVLGTI